MEMTTAPPSRRSLPPVPRTGAARPAEDAGQRFVVRLRAATAGFADAAGALTAVVPEVVPPARHRRARCRVVLRYAGGAEADLTFIGPAGRVSARDFDGQIRGWLATGDRAKRSWLVPDQAAADGVAVDLAAWLAAR
jgi:hypothetical protein